MQLCFFEDHLYSNFHPLTLNRPVDDLRLGIHTIAQKWHCALDSEGWWRLARAELQAVFSDRNPGENTPGCWINSRYLPSIKLIDKVKSLNEGTCIKSGGTAVAARVETATAKKWIQEGKPDFSSLQILEGSDFPCITRLWDLFLMNKDEIVVDLERIQKPASDNSSSTISPHAILENKEQIYISEGVTIEPGVILMAGDGPIYLGKDASIKAGAIIRGYTAICEGATVKMGAKIYPGTTIGPVCKVGGEVNNSILHSYSNKSHEGFLGNSLIGQWCNIGADTNTSNLKNNYSTIRITDWERREEIETGQQFLGTVMGDHTITAINTQLNTGTICGVSCNIFPANFPPKFIPSFSWVGSNVIQPYKIDKAFEAMDAMMLRRDVELTDDYKALMRTIAKSDKIKDKKPAL